MRFYFSSFSEHDREIQFKPKVLNIPSNWELKITGYGIVYFNNRSISNNLKIKKS